MSPRLIATIVAAIALAGIGWKVNAWRSRAAEADRVEREFEQYAADVAARDERTAKDKADDEKRREQLQVRLANLNAEIEDLRSRPVTSVVYREKPAENGVCPDPRIGPEWIGLWNDTAEAASRAVSAPR